MKKILMMILILLIQTFPSIGSPIGKGIICGCENCGVDIDYYKKIIGSFFDEKGTILYKFKEKDNEVSLDILKYYPQTITENHSIWNYYKLDRKTLKLRDRRLYDDDEDYLVCSVYTNRQSLIKEINRKEKNYQSLIDSKIVKNKI